MHALKLSIAVGRALRSARVQRGLTLHDVRRLSQDGFKASALGGYERGERNISLERFCMLAAVYGVPADRLLADALSDSSPIPAGAIVVHLDRLEQIPMETGRPIVEFVEDIRRKRGDPSARTLVLRAADIEQIADRSGLPAHELAGALSSVIELP